MNILKFKNKLLMSGRLSIVGAFNRPRTLDPLSVINDDLESDLGRPSEAQCCSKRERKIRVLKAENTKLKTELYKTQTLLKQLITESSHEKFDERRVNLLKLHIIQLERQIAILNEAVGHRQTTVLEAENVMVWLADTLRSYISADVKGPAVLVARNVLTSAVESLESARKKLFKAIEGLEKENVGKDLLLLNPFIGGKYVDKEPVSLLDISLKRMDYINLRRVSELESKMCHLYKDLIQLLQQLQDLQPTSLLMEETCSVEKERVETSLLRVSVRLKDTADDLLALSLLCPSSPNPIRRSRPTSEVSVDQVLAALPPLSGSKQRAVQMIIEKSLQVCNHQLFLSASQVAALKEELTFHNSVQQLRIQYTQDLISAVKKGYENFESSARETICKPLQEILDAYTFLKNSATEDGFRSFLLVIKSNEEKLQAVVDSFHSQDGSLAFSSFKQNFLETIDSLVKKCQATREAASLANTAALEELRRKSLELETLIQEVEYKFQQTWIPVTRTSDPATLLTSAGECHSTDQLPILESSLNSEGEGCSFVKQELKLPQNKNSKTIFEHLSGYDDINSKTEHISLRANHDSRSHTVQRQETHQNKAHKTSTCKAAGKKSVQLESSVPETARLEQKSSTFTHKTQSEAPQKYAHNSTETTMNSKKTDKHGNGKGDNPKLLSNQKPPSNQKPMSYQPKLAVANRTLKLQHSQGLSKSSELHPPSNGMIVPSQNNLEEISVQKSQTNENPTKSTRHEK